MKVKLRGACPSLSSETVEMKAFKFSKYKAGKVE